MTLWTFKRWSPTSRSAGRFIVSCVLGLLPLVAAGAEPATLRVCQNDAAHVPWRLPEGNSARASRSGLDFVFLELLAQRTGLKMQIVLQPGRRCLADLKAGLQDAILGLSHLPEREGAAAYPRRADGRVDARLAIRLDRYAWYVPTHAEVLWDGRKLGLPRGSIVGVQSSNSIGSSLRQQGYRVEDGARTAEATLEKLVRGRVDAAALLASHADRVLERVPGWHSAVRRLDPALQERAYYLVFSHAYAQQRGQADLERLWREALAVRESRAYLEAEGQALQQLGTAARAP